MSVTIRPVEKADVRGLADLIEEIYSLVTLALTPSSPPAKPSPRIHPPAQGPNSDLPSANPRTPRDSSASA